MNDAKGTQMLYSRTGKTRDTGPQLGCDAKRHVAGVTFHGDHGGGIGFTLAHTRRSPAAELRAGDWNGGPGGALGGLEVGLASANSNGAGARDSPELRRTKLSPGAGIRIVIWAVRGQQAVVTARVDPRRRRGARARSFICVPRNLLRRPKALVRARRAWEGGGAGAGRAVLVLLVGVRALGHWQVLHA